MPEKACYVAARENWLQRSNSVTVGVALLPLSNQTLWERCAQRADRSRSTALAKLAQQHVGYPVSVLADGTDTGDEWARHVLNAVPELSIYELARHLADTNAQLTEAVMSGRRAGLSWTQIARAAGTTADQAARRWGPAAARPLKPQARRQDRRASGPETGPAR